MDQWLFSLVDKYNGYGILLYVVLTTLIAGILSSFIGLEREFKGQAAGLRTHVIVCISCSLLMSLSIYGISTALKGSKNYSNLYYDAARIGAGILGGVGFIGAGTIIKNGFSIRGLTTAGTIWFCSALGMACGTGFILEAIAVVAITMFFLISLSYLERFFDRKSQRLTLVVAASVPLLNELRKEADNNSLVVKNIASKNIKTKDNADAVEITVYFAYQSDKTAIMDMKDKFASLPYVYSCTLGGKKSLKS